MKRPNLKQALGRLLGPAGREVGCDECFAELESSPSGWLQCARRRRAGKCSTLRPLKRSVDPKRPHLPKTLNESWSSHGSAPSVS
jgi:hypothetical protein